MKTARRETDPQHGTPLNIHYEGRISILENYRVPSSLSELDDFIEGSSNVRHLVLSRFLFFFSVGIVANENASSTAW